MSFSLARACLRPKSGRTSAITTLVECGGLQTIERRHNNAARARDVALEEEVGARRSAESMAEELNSSTRR